MNREEIEGIFTKTGTVLKGHFVLKNRGVKDDYYGKAGCGDHSDLYVNKDAIFPYPLYLKLLCEEIAKHFYDNRIYIDLVAGPAVGAIAQIVYLRDALADLQKTPVYAVYAEDGPNDKKIFKRGFDMFLTGIVGRKYKRVLAAEDIITTGGSCKKVVDAVRAGGGEVVGATVLCNRGGITAEELGVPYLFSLYGLEGVMKWPMEKCPHCEKGVHINTEVGHGQKFLDIRDTLPILKR